MKWPTWLSLLCVSIQMCLGEDWVGGIFLFSFVFISEQIFSSDDKDIFSNEYLLECKFVMLFCVQNFGIWFSARIFLGTLSHPPNPRLHPPSPPRNFLMQFSLGPRTGPRQAAPAEFFFISVNVRTFSKSEKFPLLYLSHQIDVKTVRQTSWKLYFAKTSDFRGLQGKTALVRILYKLVKFPNTFLAFFY